MTLPKPLARIGGWRVASLRENEFSSEKRRENYFIHCTTVLDQGRDRWIKYHILDTLIGSDKAMVCSQVDQLKIELLMHKILLQKLEKVQN